MPDPLFLRSVRIIASFLLFFFFIPSLRAQGSKQATSETKVESGDADHVKERNEWFARGRLVRGQPSAELRRRAYQAKMQERARRAAALALAGLSAQGITTTGSWIPLGPVPLASDATGNGTQDYHQVAGRATAVAIDPADPTGNTVYIGGAQSGVWKSVNGANPTANSVTWIPVTDNQATLSIGAIAIQPGNSDVGKSLVLAATGEANSSLDSYFGLGILRSADGGNTWTLINTANNGGLSFSGLGGTRMAFSSARNTTVVSAMATSSEGQIDGAITANTERGLYTSLDGGQTWTYDALVDPGGATDATSATSVVYNSGAGLFYAAVRYHGLYSSPDGVNWTRLANQPGGSLLNASACPPQSISNNYACPIYRAELTTIPGRNEMYAWYVYFSAGDLVDGGIWQSLNGGASWTSIADSSITNCGDFDGCGVEQGDYNLELLAVPSASGTDLYAGAINLYKCSVNSQNPTCSNAPFLNLTHVYGCNPIAAPAHVHPDQHALAYMIPATGTDSGNGLMYFANDGGMYRALNGFVGLITGSCSGTNQFDDLNQNLGSMTQFVGFSQHPTDPNTLLGGTQDNGSPATNQATSNLSWSNVLGGDGGYNAIDPTTPSNFYASNPDIPPGGLGVQSCTKGVACTNSGFSFVVTSNAIGGDDGGFYFPYILDAQSSWGMVVGSCRIWRGSRSGGAFTVLSPNFETLGTGTCTGNEVNQLRAIAAGGPTDSNGSKVIYATTNGNGPLDLQSIVGGHVWVTTNATAGSSSFADVTDNGPQGSINPNEFPVSGVALDPSDASGKTAYVTVMGFTGGVGHVWKTTNAGVSWVDFTGNLPDSPVNTVLVDGSAGVIYVGSDVGVFASTTSAASWTELGPAPSSNQYGFLPNVAVTGLGLFNSGGQKLLRASTYGRGIWQYNLIVTPDFQISVPTATQTIFAGQTATFSGSATAVNGYASSVTLSCVAGTTAPPSTCSATPSSLTPVKNTPFTLTAAGAVGDYAFNLQGAGSDSNHVTHAVPITLHVVNFGMTAPSPSSVTVAHGATSPAVSFQVTAAGSFNQAVTISCTVATISGASCNLTPAATVYPTASAPVNMTASVAVPSTASAGSYTVTLQATTNGAPATITTSFTLVVTSNPNFTLTEPTSFPEVNAGSTGINGPISITAQDGFNGTVALSCSNTYGAGSCGVSPTSVSSYPATATLTINGTSFTVGSYSITVTGTSGALTNSVAVPFNVGDYSIAGTQALTMAPGGQGTANLTLTSTSSYSGKINATCDISAIPSAVCLLSPANPITLGIGGTASVTATINVPNNAAAGAYNVSINTQDTTGAPTHKFSIAITVGQDFEVISTTSSQTVSPGQTSGPYNLTVQPVGSSFNGAVTLACSGLPSLSQCTFAPSAPVTPGNSPVNVVMTISTTASTVAAVNGSRGWYVAFFLLSPGMLLLWRSGGTVQARKRAVWMALGLMLGTLLMLPACSGVSSGGGGGGGGGHQGTLPGTYQITVTGTSPGIATNGAHSAQVTLVVN